MEAMTNFDSFTGLDTYKLTRVTVTDKVLGHGSYATVLELEYMGLKCAGKKIHELLLEQGGASYTVRRFEEECHLLSQVRHPNVVQFLGVHFQEGVLAPILVMEFLPTNLTSCIEQYGILPKEISFTILHDVSLGLCYLHSQTLPIIHRDLSSNNVLLTPNMTAKISDLGVARILNLTPLQISRMTQTPGTPAYMPPEVMVANPKYDTSVDVFSYGILMIHMFSGRWPEPQVGPNRTEHGRLIPVTEAERREEFLRTIRNDHPLMDVIQRCINNDARVRPNTNDLACRLAEMVLQFPLSFANQIQRMLEKDNYVEKGEKYAMNFPRLPQENKKHNKPEEMLKVSVGKSLQELKFEVDHLQLMLNDMQMQQRVVESEKKAQEKENICSQKEIKSLKQKIKKQESLEKNVAKAYEESMANERKSVREALKAEYDCMLHDERLSHERVLQKERQRYQAMIEEQKAEGNRKEKELQKSKKAYEKAIDETFALKAENLTSNSTIESLQSSVSRLEATMAAKEELFSSKDAELKVKTRAIQEKNCTISAMSEQLTKTRQHMATIKQAQITWKRCEDLPVTMCNGKTVIIDDNVYFRGMCPQDEDDDNILLCYDHKLDHWSALPPLPVKWFGLGMVSGKLVAVGGLKKDEEATNNVYTLNFVQKWKSTTFPPMPTARSLPGVLSLREILIVAGGYSSEGDHDSVEIFNSSSMQWYRTYPLPVVCREVSIVAIDDTCYAVGGYKFPFRLNQAVCSSIKDLLQNAIPANHTAYRGGSIENTQSAWTTLANTPAYRPAAAVLAGALVVLGGGESSMGEADKKEVYMFSPSTNSWVYICDLPEPRSRTTTAQLSSTEILVIGGVEGGKQYNDMHKGTLHITK